MANFFSKLFGGGKKTSSIESLVQENLEKLIELSGFDLTFDLSYKKEDDGHSILTVNFSGGDEELLKDRKGQLLDAFQLYTKRIVQHNFSDERTSVQVDCGGYREESEHALIERAENLKSIAIEQSRAVYYRALPPKERKVVHQHLAKDPRVKSRSIGEGLYKKIKIYPVKNQQADVTEASQMD